MASTSASILENAVELKSKGLTGAAIIVVSVEVERALVFPMIRVRFRCCQVLVLLISGGNSVAVALAKT